ncbi:hypothetical protein CBS101457_002998 [Exobasidium rhododendri]|nr:hypothetical protein CBS101457_002998 [Exobasidium rhododendri]
MHRGPAFNDGFKTSRTSRQYAQEQAQRLRRLQEGQHYGGYDDSFLFSRNVSAYEGGSSSTPAADTYGGLFHSVPPSQALGDQAYVRPDDQIMALYPQYRHETHGTTQIQQGRETDHHTDQENTTSEQFHHPHTTRQTYSDQFYRGSFHQPQYTQQDVSFQISNAGQTAHLPYQYYGGEEEPSGRFGVPVHDPATFPDLSLINMPDQGFSFNPSLADHYQNQVDQQWQQHSHPHYMPALDGYSNTSTLTHAQPWTEQAYDPNDSAHRELLLQVEHARQNEHFGTSYSHLAEYKPPPEYQLHPDPHFEYDEAVEAEPVYRRLSQDQKLVVMDRIHQTRPYVMKYIREQLDRKLTPALAHDLLSTDVTAIDDGVQRLFPIDRDSHSFKKTKYGGLLPWMDGLSKEQRIAVVQNFSEATLQSADLVRDMFVRKSVIVTPALAWQILHSNHDQCRTIAGAYHLFVQENDTRKKRWPWQFGCSKIQRRAIIQRMTRAGVKDNDVKRYKLLEQHFVHAGYGLEILQASDETFRMMMDSLLKGVPFLPLH